MEQRDYLKKQFELCGRVVGKMIADLLGLKSQVQINEEIDLLTESRREELEIEVEALMTIPQEDLINILKIERDLTNEALGYLADIVFVIAQGRMDSEAKRKMYYEKCLIIYEYLDKEDKVYSLERQMKIKQIKPLLSD